MGQTTTPVAVWTDDDGDPVELTPKQLLENYYSEEFIDVHGGASLFEQLFTPRTRALVLSELVAEGGDPLTASMIVERHEDLSTSGFARHKDALLDFGVMVKVDRVGNAQRYALNTEHPISQLLQMLRTITEWGRTKQLLDDAFVFEGDGDDLLEALREEDVQIGGE